MVALERSMRTPRPKPPYRSRRIKQMAARVRDGCGATIAAVCAGGGSGDLRLHAVLCLCVGDGALLAFAAQRAHIQAHAIGQLAAGGLDHKSVGLKIMLTGLTACDKGQTRAHEQHEKLMYLTVFIYNSFKKMGKSTLIITQKEQKGNTLFALFAVLATCRKNFGRWYKTVSDFCAGCLWVSVRRVKSDTSYGRQGSRARHPPGRTASHPMRSRCPRRSRAARTRHPHSERVQ